MKIGKLRLTHADKFVIAEFVLIVLASIAFIAGFFVYLESSSFHGWTWISFALFMLAKSWLEFWETHQDRRVHTMTVEELNKLDIQLKRMGDI